MDEDMMLKRNVGNAEKIMKFVSEEEKRSHGEQTAETNYHKRDHSARSIAEIMDGMPIFKRSHHIEKKNYMDKKNYIDKKSEKESIANEIIAEEITEFTDKIVELERSNKHQAEELQMLEQFLLKSEEGDKFKEKDNFEAKRSHHENEEENKESKQRELEAFKDLLGIERKRNEDQEKEKRGHDESENFLKRAFDIMEKRGSDKHSSRVMYKRNGNFDPIKMLEEIHAKAQNNYKQKQLDGVMKRAMAKYFEEWGSKNSVSDFFAKCFSM